MYVCGREHSDRHRSTLKKQQIDNHLIINDMKKCPNCGLEYDDAVKFCRECGTALVSTKIYCSKCGAEYEAGTKFCAECGTPLQVAPKPAPQPEMVNEDLKAKLLAAKKVVETPSEPVAKSYLVYDSKGEHTFSINIDCLDLPNGALLTSMDKDVDITFDDGSTYSGRMFEGYRQGFGNSKGSNGAIYEGEWRSGLRNGQGKVTFANGDYYTCEWKDGVECGKVDYICSDGRIYQGACVAGKWTGKGKLVCKNGDIYECEWKDGSINGQGRAIYSNGNEYRGEWKDGKYCGLG